MTTEKIKNKMEAMICSICEKAIEQILDLVISVCKKCANYAITSLHHAMTMIRKQEEMKALGEEAEKKSKKFHEEIKKK